MVRVLGPEIEERKRRLKEAGANYAGKPNDVLSWLIDGAPSGLEQTTESLALRMLNVNFMGIHSTSVSFAHELYYLASEPRYTEILRSEVEEYLGSPGDGDLSRWTEANLENCQKLDSFMKESVRISGIGAIGVPRKALVECTLADGSVIPPGTIVSIAAGPTQVDDANYTNAKQFDGLRFASMREQATSSEAGISAEEDARLRLTGAGPTFLIFGGGRHLCPGRFFAAIELKCLMAYLVIHYDVKTVEDGVRPPDEWVGPICSPAKDAKILFRRRQI